MERVKGEPACPPPPLLDSPLRNPRPFIGHTFHFLQHSSPMTHYPVRQTAGLPGKHPALSDIPAHVSDAVAFYALPSTQHLPSRFTHTAAFTLNCHRRLPSRRHAAETTAQTYFPSMAAAHPQTHHFLPQTAEGMAQSHLISANTFWRSTI